MEEQFNLLELSMATARSIYLNQVSSSLAALRGQPDWEELLLDSEQALTILIVDDVAINRRLIRATLKDSPYRILEARRASDAFQILETEKVDLLIVDMMLPELSGPDFCRRVKAERRTHLLPILMLTSVHGVENEVAGISSGADEFLTKPLHPAVVRARVRAMLQTKLTIDSLDEAEAILFGLAQAVEKRDQSTGDHCQRLAVYGVALGKALGLSPSRLRALYRGGFLHDIGKVAVPDAILFKPGRLTPEEWAVMTRHTLVGEEICRPMKSLALVLPIIRSHHERWDGTGYPDRLAGENIPLLARILQTVDIYDALTSKRSYKEAFTHQEALAILDREAGQGWRDIELLKVFREVILQPFDDGGSAPDESGSILQSIENMNRAVSA